MSGLLRTVYGHGGTRSRRILVSVPAVASPPAPRWVRLLLLIVWIVVPVLVSLYAIPTATLQMRTVIDISRLEMKPPFEQERPVMHEPKSLPPVQPLPPPQIEQQPLVRPTIAPPLEVKPPVITRPAMRLPEEVDYQPRISRERLRETTDAATPAVPRIRREAVVNEVPDAPRAITRTRGASGADAPADKERVAPLRRGGVAQGLIAGEDAAVRLIPRKERPAGSPATSDLNRQRIDATRERSQIPDRSSGADASIGIARGITLSSLGICSSPQQEEDDIKAVLSVIGSRQNCTDEKGEFQFKATKRISSFNLIIFPAKGRRPSNRCEELKNAYSCLKTH